MSNPDFSQLNPEQERALRDAYRYIRQRAAWLRSQKSAVEEQNAQTETSVIPNNSQVDIVLSK